MRAAGNAATRTAATHMHRYGGSADIWKTQGSRKTKSCFNKTCQTYQAIRNLLVLRATTM